MNGTIGVRGVNADIDVPVDEVLQHLDMIFAMRAEARKGPFGIYGEVIYIGLSDGAQINGLINNIHEQVDMTLVDGGLSWRLFNQPRWSLDLTAGTHYTNVYEQLELHSDPALIQQTSERFVNNIAEFLRERLDQDISNSEFLEALKNTIKADIINRIGNALERHENRPDIPIGPLGGRIRKEIAQRVGNFIEFKKAELRARVDALVERGIARRDAVAIVVNEAKTRIANQLALRLNKSLSQTLSKDDFWFDPYVGLRTRYNFNKTYYTAVRGEIGGFGVGADLMWEVEAVVGINLTRSIFTEIGYRALGGNFEDRDFRFDVVMHGPQITTGITF
jgi:DNA-binding Lrp family transcriptional regulator